MLRKVLIGCLMMGSFARTVHAQVLNGDFKTGLAEWDVLNSYNPQISSSGLELKDASNLRQDIFSRISVGKSYNLNVTGLATNAQINLVVGVRFFDASWGPLGDQSVKIDSSSSSTKSIKVTPPSGTAKAFVYIRRYAAASTAGVGYLSKISMSVPTSSSALLYKQPVLTNPKTINLPTGYSAHTLLDNTDYILKMPSTPKTGATVIMGGRNVVMIGGHVKMDPKVNTQTGGDIYRRAIYVKDNKGTVHIEGIHIEGDSSTTFDGIGIAAPDSIVQIQNIRMTNLYGTNSGFHADMVQPFGGVKELRVDKFTGSSYYQGFQIASKSFPIGHVKLSRVNVESVGAATKQSGGQLLWFISTNSGFDCSRSFPVTLSEFYIKYRPDGWGLGTSAYPMGSTKDDYGVMCGGVLNAEKTQISFPYLPVTGIVKGGAPSTGDFVPMGVAGINYKSPGYK